MLGRRPRGACGPLESRVRSVLWYHSCICWCGFCLWRAYRDGFSTSSNVLTCNLPKTCIARLCAGRMLIGWQVGGSSSAAEIISDQKVKYLKDRERAVIPFIVFNGPTTTTQVRVADTPVGPHTLDTASIWQQTLSAGRRAARSPPQIENTLQMENYVWPIRWGLLAQLNSFTPNWDKHMLMHLALSGLM